MESSMNLKNVKLGFLMGFSICFWFQTPAFSENETGKILTIDGATGRIEIARGETEKPEWTYFSNQRNGFWWNLFTPVRNLFYFFFDPFNSRGDVQCVIEYSGDKSLVAIYREAPRLHFKKELTLLDQNGNVLFQNRDPNLFVGRPIEVFKDLQIVVIDMFPLDAREQYLEKYSSDTHHYFGINFKGQKVWEFCCEEMGFDWNDLRKEKIQKTGLMDLYIFHWNTGKMSDTYWLSTEPTGLVLDARTGAVFKSNSLKKQRRIP